MGLGVRAEVVACATDGTRIVKQRRNPWSPQLCIRICVRAMISLLKSHCRFANLVDRKFETHFR